MLLAYFLYFTVSILLAGADFSGGKMLNLEVLFWEPFPYFFLCVFCMHSLCTADMTAGGGPNTVSHIDS